MGERAMRELKNSAALAGLMGPVARHKRIYLLCSRAATVRRWLVGDVSFQAGLGAWGESPTRG